MKNLSERRGALRRAAFWEMALGVPMNLFWALSYWFDPPGTTYVFPLAGTLWYVGAPLMALGRMGLAALTLGRFRDAFTHLAAVGRMALINYLAQSGPITGALYGFGLYGSAGVGVALGVMAEIWTLEFLWSRLWLYRHRYGSAALEDADLRVSAGFAARILDESANGL